MSTSKVLLQKVEKQYGETTILAALDLAVRDAFAFEAEPRKGGVDGFEAGVTAQLVR